MMRALIALLVITSTAPVQAFADDLPQRPLFSPSAGFVTQAPGAQPQPHAAASQQTLASFMYFAPDKWSFWWQGRRVAPGAIPDDMTDVSVTPGSVRFTQHGTQHEFLTGKF